MTPVIDGETYHFETRGIYEGVSILYDRETEGYWHHLTGECLHGPRRGARLEGAAPIVHTTVGQALDAYPDLMAAVSDRPVRGRGSRWWPVAEKIAVLPDRFKASIAGEDTRRPTMDIGIGVWTDEVQRYYPMEDVVGNGDVIVDDFAGRRLLVYYDPTARALTAAYTRARTATWDGDDLLLDTGERIRNGALYGADGIQRELERPLQVFTRWYGFALTFPGTEIFEP